MGNKYNEKKLTISGQHNWEKPILNDVGRTKLRKPIASDAGNKYNEKKLTIPDAGNTTGKSQLLLMQATQDRKKPIVSDVGNKYNKATLWGKNYPDKRVNFEQLLGKKGLLIIFHL